MTTTNNVCAHGVPISYGRCYQCEEELRLAQFKAAFPGEDQRNERRAKWIRENVASFRDGWDLEAAIDRAEGMYERLIKRGYL